MTAGSPLDCTLALVALLREFHKECEGCPVEDLCDQAEALVNVAKAAEPMAKLPAPITADERQEWIIRQNALREELAVLDKEQT